MIDLDQIVESLDRVFQQENNFNLTEAKDLVKEEKKLDPKAKKTIEIVEFRKNKSSAEMIELQGRKDFFRLRKNWSRMINIWISTFILFHSGVALAVGLGHLNYENHHSILLTIIAEDFLQILGMVYIVVKFLFPDVGRIKKND